MHRQELLSLLQRYRTPFNTEAGYITRMRRFVEQHEDCFDSRLCLTWLSTICASGRDPPEE